MPFRYRLVVVVSTTSGFLLCVMFQLITKGWASEALPIQLMHIRAVDTLLFIATVTAVALLLNQVFALARRVQKLENLVTVLLARVEDNQRAAIPPDVLPTPRPPHGITAGR